MTKSEVVSEICKKTGIDRAEALQCVEAFMEVVKESLIKERMYTSVVLVASS